MLLSYPAGVPLYWQNEASGRLKTAVLNFFHKRETEEDLALVIWYIQHWIDAPCWTPNEAIEQLRRDAHQLNNISSVFPI